MALVIGLLILGYGIYSVTSNDVDCGGQTMNAGDECVSSQAGSSTTRSMSEQNADNHRMGWFGMVIGLGIASYGGWSIYRAFGTRHEQQVPVQPGPTPSA